MEKVKARMQQEKLNERNAILAIQKEMKDRKTAEQKNIVEKEKEMLKYEWERQSELEKIKEQQEI